MTTISKIVIVLFLSLTIVAFDYIINKIRTNKNKGKVESKEEIEKKLKLAEDKKAKEDYSMYPYNEYLENWINIVINDGIQKVYSDFSKYSEKSDGYYYYLITKNYICKFWKENKYYAWVSQGYIIKNSKDSSITQKERYDDKVNTILEWDNSSISKETRYKLYKLIEGYKEINGDITGYDYYRYE